ncbi:MAG: hypothetical protein ACRC2S_08295 [Waterburya sp.]
MPDYPDYVSGRHKPVECNASKCSIQLSKYLYETNTLETRFTAEICDLLDFEERRMWNEWSKEQHEKRKLALGLLDTTNNPCSV